MEMGLSFDLQSEGDSFSDAEVLGEAPPGFEAPLSGLLALSPVLLAELGAEVEVSKGCRSASSDGSALSLTLPLTPSGSFFGVST